MGPADCCKDFDGFKMSLSGFEMDSSDLCKGFEVFERGFIFLKWVSLISVNIIMVLK